MPSFTIPFRFLKAALKFVSTDETRDVLNGIRVELTPGKDIGIIATDGRRLIHATPDIQHDAKAETAFTIPRGPLECVNFPFVEPQEDETGRSGTVSVDRVRVSMERDSITLEFVRKGFSISVEQVGGVYPNWRLVIPSPLPTNFPAKRVLLNGEMFSEMLSAATILSNGKGFQIASPAEPETPIIITAAHLMMILMPMRGEI